MRQGLNVSNEVISIHGSKISKSARIVPLVVGSLLFPAVDPEPREVRA